MTVTNAKSSAESEKFALKIRSKSGKLFTIERYFPPKSADFGTLLTLVPLTGVVSVEVVAHGGLVPAAEDVGSAAVLGGRMAVPQERRTGRVVRPVLRHRLLGPPQGVCGQTDRQTGRSAGHWSGRHRKLNQQAVTEG